MCVPLAIATLAITVASTIASTVAQQQQASAQAAQNKLTTLNANANLRNQYTQAQQQVMAQGQEGAQKQQQAQQQTRAAIATAQTSAGENGVSGVSMTDIANEYLGKQATYNADVNLNQQMADSEIAEQMTGFRTGTQSRINAEPVPDFPSAFGLGLGILGDAAKAASSDPDAFSGSTTKGLNAAGYRATGAGPGASNNTVVSGMPQSSWWTTPLF